MTGPVAASRHGRVLPLDQFAVWARTRRIALPYPLDVAAVPGFRVPRPDEDRTLEAVAAVCTSPRVSLLFLRHEPGVGVVSRAVALADTGSSAVSIRMDATHVAARVVPDTALAATIAELLPTLAPVPARFTIEESRWTALLDLAGSGASPDRVNAAFAAAAVPDTVAAAVTQAGSHHVPTGFIGVQTWPGGVATMSARSAAWFEYPSGTLLVDRVHDARTHLGMLRIGPWTSGELVGTLATLVADGLRAA